jgi:hypothetical protein
MLRLTRWTHIRHVNRPLVLLGIIGEMLFDAIMRSSLGGVLFSINT